MAASELTVTDYLAAPLGVMRVRELERLARRCAAADLETTVTDLRAALCKGVGLEAFRRLHILISYLYHEQGADIPLTTDLRAEVGEALALRGAMARATDHAKGGVPMSCSNPDCRKGGCTTEPQPTERPAARH